VTRVAPYVLDLEAQNRTVEIEVELDDSALAARLLPGTSADVEVILEATPGALRVPTAAVLAGDLVLVLDGGVLVERAIERGLGNWEWTEVRSGLAAGERVVTSFDSTEVRAGARAVEAPSESAP
jgi:HlyD family secretion protein